MRVETSISHGDVLGLHAALPVAVAEVRPADGILLSVNAAWREMFGYSEDEAVGQHVSLVAAPLEHAPHEHAAEMTGALDHGGRWSGRVQGVRKDGTRLWTAMHVARHDDPERGRVLVTVQSDITAQHAAGAAFAEAAAGWRSAFEDAPVAMAIIGRDLRMTDVNARLCAMTGYARGELIGVSRTTLSHPDDVAEDAELAAQMRAGELSSYRLSVRLITRDGASIPVVVTVSLVRGPDGRPVHELAVIDRR